METLKLLTNICNGFKQKKFNLEEFQSRLRTLAIEDDIKLYLEKALNDADSRLEEIRFCSLESNFYSYGAEVADSLLEKVESWKLE